jgi:hypothetical protein
MSTASDAFCGASNEPDAAAGLLERQRRGVADALDAHEAWPSGLPPPRDVAVLRLVREPLATTEQRITTDRAAPASFRLQGLL